MRKFIRFLIGMMACAVLAYSSYQLYIFFTETSASSRLNTSMVEEYVTVKPRPEAPAVPDQTAEPGQTLPAETQAPLETPPIEVDFAQLRQQSGNVIGWLYCEDTPVNLPVAQSDDNAYYLRRLLDGTDNNAGTLFADYRNAPDFSDRNTVIYGHNMKNKTMFGSIGDYRDQEYYDTHPVWWLLTENGNYKLELVAGYVTASTSEAYDHPDTDEEALDLARLAVESSTFQTALTLNPGDRYVTMSTCSYEFDNARYVLVARLVPAA
ncbi:MAG: class B sortase [Eubacteriales bacterium]|nr:class B sortase [Eubacteriales bacterium]